MKPHVSPLSAPRSRREQYTAAAELLGATLVWGFGFTATLWALQSVDPVSMTVFRFFVAFLIGQLILFLPHLRSEIHRQNFWMSAIPGGLLGLVLVLQTWGLEHTSVTNSGFITTLYVVMVPLIEAFVLKQHIRRMQVFWVFLALVGTGFMVNVLNMTQLNLGDALTFACAVLISLQIVAVGRISHKVTSAFALNTYQSFWASLSALIFWPIYGETYFREPNTLALWGLLSLTLGSTMLGFALQVSAQKRLSPSVASVIFLLESPFAALFAFFILEEKISGLQLFGGVLIFIAALGCVRTPTPAMLSPNAIK